MVIESVVKVTVDYRVTIPVRMRRKFKVAKGELVKVIYDEKENVIIVKPVPKEVYTK